MPIGHHARAIQAIADLQLNGANREVASYWLSRWREDAPPTIDGFRESNVWEHAPAIAVFEVRRGESMRCIRSGAFYRLALGYDLAGQDVMSITAAAERQERLAYNWKIVEGAVSVSHLAFKSADGSQRLAQCTGLPYRDREGDDTGFMFMHCNWRPAGDDWIVGNAQGESQLPPERRLVPFVKSFEAAPV